MLPSLQAKRFTAVATAADGLHATVVGTAGEVVHVTALRAKTDGSFRVVVQNATVGADRSAQVLIQTTSRQGAQRG